MISMPPVVAFRGPRYFTAENPEGYGIGLNNAYLNTLTANVPALQYLDQFEQRNFKIRGNAYLDFRILEGLTTALTLVWKKLTTRAKASAHLERFARVHLRQITTLLANFRNTGRFESQLLEHTVNYEKAFGAHRISAVGGLSLQKFEHPTFRFTTIQGSATTEDPYRNRWNNIGILGRVNYNYNDKYLTSLTFRRDGSSLFGENNRWGNFPSASVAWRISREDFWKSGTVNDLKLRASYGSLGNSEFLQPWLYYAQINPFPRAVFGPDSVEQIGQIVTRLANSDLTLGAEEYYQLWFGCRLP
jgi:hypothetical protein